MKKKQKRREGRRRRLMRRKKKMKLKQKKEEEESKMDKETPSTQIQDYNWNGCIKDKVYTEVQWRRNLRQDKMVYLIMNAQLKNIQTFRIWRHKTSSSGNATSCKILKSIETTIRDIFTFNLSSCKRKYWNWKCIS